VCASDFAETSEAQSNSGAPAVTITPGDLIVVLASCDNVSGSCAESSISGAGCTWTPGPTESASFGGEGFYSGIFYCTASSTAAISVGYSSATISSTIAYDFSVAGSSPTIDDSLTAETSGSCTSSPSFATPSCHDMEIAGFVGADLTDMNGITTPDWTYVTGVEFSSSGYNTSGINSTSVTVSAPICSEILSTLAAFKDTL